MVTPMSLKGAGCAAAAPAVSIEAAITAAQVRLIESTAVLLSRHPGDAGDDNVFLFVHPVTTRSSGRQESPRSATTGSTCMARRAGIQQAASATTSSAPGTA